MWFILKVPLYAKLNQNPWSNCGWFQDKVGTKHSSQRWQIFKSFKLLWKTKCSSYLLWFSLVSWNYIVKSFILMHPTVCNVVSFRKYLMPKCLLSFDMPSSMEILQQMMCLDLYWENLKFVDSSPISWPDLNQFYDRLGAYLLPDNLIIFKLLSFKYVS